MATEAVLLQAEAAAADILAVYDKHGDSDYIGEAVSSLEHSIQAARLAATAEFDVAVIAGALLHDIGHLLGLMQPEKYERMGDCGVVAHEGIGGAFLESKGLPEVTCAIVRRHVDAKRFLCWSTPGYHDRLSEASKTTLTYQGGPMTADEAADFNVDPLKETILAMRRWDEAAKVPGLVVPDLASYKPMLVKLIAKELMRRAAAEAVPVDAANENSKA